MLLGSTVRVTESGMGCSSWPLCNGQIGPIDHFHALLEQSHRYLAAAVSIGVVALNVLARREPVRSLRRWSAVALGIVAVQVVLGAITVLTSNAPATVAAHLVVGLLLLAATALAAAASYGLGERRKGLGGLGGAAAAATLVVLVSGTLVVDGGASASCPSWPWCTAHAGAPWHLVAIQLVHRGVVAAACGLLVALALRLLRLARRPSPARILAHAILVLLPLQVGVGALDAVSRAREALQDIHVALAGALWCLTVVAVLGAGRPQGLDRQLPAAAMDRLADAAATSGE